MPTRFARLSVLHALALCACFIMGILAGPASAQTTGSLVDELRTALAQGGADAARQRFAEIWPARKDRYPHDPRAFMQLMQEQAQTGSMDTLQALAEINMQLLQEALGAAQAGARAGPGASAELERALAEQQDRAAAVEERTAAAQRETQERRAAQERGAARDDLERFTGMYGEGGRQLFVKATCDGHLAAAPMWADIAPWWLRSAADAVFSYSDNFLAFAMEFELDGKGRAIALRHDLDGMPNPMRRSGDLPPELRECLPTPTR